MSRSCQAPHSALNGDHPSGMDGLARTEWQTAEMRNCLIRLAVFWSFHKGTRSLHILNSSSSRLTAAALAPQWLLQSFHQALVNLATISWMQFAPPNAME